MKNLAIVGAMLALFTVSAGAQATQITATYNVYANGSDPGLKIGTANLAPDAFSYDLEAGESKTFDLFEIWADESAVNWNDHNWDLDFNDGDDIAAKPISVEFDLLFPELHAGSVAGTTMGNVDGFLGFSQWGELTWDAPLDFFFGGLGDGHIRIVLSDEAFNEGILWGLGDHGAIVEATLTLVQDATVVAVPAPGAFVLFGLGILGMVVAVRRRQPSAPLA